MPSRPRRPIPIDTQVGVYFRDRWLCHLCHRPIVFHLALKYAGQFVAAHYPQAKLAYWQGNWRRDAAPLLDELGACIDHVEAFSRGGRDDDSNYAAVCSRCNTRKSDRAKAQFLDEAKPWKVKGKYGEPSNWDGLTSLFVALIATGKFNLTTSDRRWLQALERQLGRPRA